MASATDHGRQRAFWVQAAGWASVTTAVVILVLKAVAWQRTGAASVLAALVDSLMDLVSSALNLLALRYAVQPPDVEHRYGHGKAEALAAFVQALLLVLSATGILYYALHRLWRGEVPALGFVENPDILAGVAASARAQGGSLYCVGFAAESHDLLAHAQAKRARKGVPLLVGNIGPDTFGRDDNALLLVDESGHTELPRAGKLALARQLVAQIARRLPPH